MSEEPLIDEPEQSSGSGAMVKVVFLTLIGVGLAAFVVQNTDRTPVQWLIFDGSAPLWTVIIAAAVAGALLTEFGGWMIRRRKRR